MQHLKFSLHVISGKSNVLSEDSEHQISMKSYPRFFYISLNFKNKNTQTLLVQTIKFYTITTKIIPVER